MTNKEKEKLNYIAGIIDGEGYLGIGRMKSNIGNYCYYARITVHMQQVEGIKVICDYFSLPIKRSCLNKKYYFSFYQTNPKTLLKILKTIYPYLRIKKNQADLLIKLLINKRKIQPTFYFSKGKFRGNTSIPKPTQDYRASLYHQLKQIRDSDSKQTLKI